MASKRTARKLWTNESMIAAVQYVLDGNGLKEASRLYNIPVETLRRRVTGAVKIGARPGPKKRRTNFPGTLYRWQIWAREDVMHIAFALAEKCHEKHPFKGGKAGRAWYEGFMSRHPKLTIRSPQALSFCRARSATKDTIEDFFGKLGSIYGRLNLITKPMQVYNADETGVTIVHKPGKVVAELGRKHVYSVTSAERGKTHTILSVVSASGFYLPPMMVYPRKLAVPDSHRKGALPNTTSHNGWINQELYSERFDFFIENIPPARPVLLIQDGHGSHVSIDLIEKARKNNVHLLCLPSHTTHILQLLDVGVFKSFKTHFSKACHRYITSNPALYLQGVHNVSKATDVTDQLQELAIDDDDDDVPCAKCKLTSCDLDGPWVQCDGCRGWYHMACAKVEESSVPELFFCDSC